MTGRAQGWLNFLQGLGDALQCHGPYPLVADGRLDRRTYERLVNSFMDMRVGGLMLAGTMEVSDAIIEAANRIPTVMGGNRLFDSPTSDVVAQDDELVAQLALDHLSIAWTSPDRPYRRRLRRGPWPPESRLQRDDESRRASPQTSSYATPAKKAASRLDSVSSIGPLLSVPRQSSRLAI